MKLTRKLEAEIKQVMTTYWDSYVGGDLKTWASFLPTNYRNIGTTQEEIWNTKKEIVDYTDAIIDQMVGMAEFRDKQVQVIPYDPYFMVHELGDLFIKINDNWSFYSKIRLSSLIQKTDSGWKILHQHGSYPDSKTQQGEAFAFDEVKAENIKLQDAVKNRTAELEKKTRELEIESSLERVRAVAMGMRKPADMLDICHTIAQQLELLKVKNIRNVQTAIFYESKGTYVNYEYYAKHDKLLITEVDFKSHEIQSLFANQMLTGAEELFTVVLKGQELTDWYNYQKTTNQFVDVYLENADSLNYHWYSLGPVALGISTYWPLADEEITLFKRFRNVFELAYRRFVDIENAEAQAREAKIQLALERVRARSMAMHNSEELKDVIQVVYEQFVHLNIDIDHVGFVVDYKPKGDWHFWIADQQEIPSKITHPYFDSVWASQFDDAKEKGSYLFTTKLNFEEKNKFYNELLLYVPGLPESSKEFYLTCPGLAASTVLFDNVSLYIENFSGTPYADEVNTILMRFGNVFQQTYTRFLDLQKAEAQAREARIEAALERVRSRSLAMHKSDELNEIVSIVFERLKELQIPFTAVGIGIYIDGSKDLNGYVCGENEDGLVISNYRLPYFNHKISEDFNTAREKQLDFFVGHYSKDEKNSFYEYVIEHAAELKKLPEDIKRVIFESPSYTLSMVAVNNAVFSINDFEGKTLTENEVDIIKRFARVFDQAYTRFLDLQKAEAQIREARIEAALERTRTQSMLMQHSNELDEISKVFHEQLLGLGIDSEFSFVWLPDEEKDEHLFWATWQTEKGGKTEVQSKSIAYPMDLTEPTTLACVDDWKSGVSVHEHFIPPLEIQNFFVAWEELLAGAEKLKPEYFPDGIYYTEAFMKYGCFGIDIRRPLSEKEKSILNRFAIEFERAYTRFLDLQKAEAQALRAEQDIIEIKSARKKAEDALIELQITQKQLIQSEKMASLGELTAGIAHEIQNPLNFVNNFSDVSTELIDEMNIEIEKGNSEEAKQIARDLKQNLEKINHHGKRAGDIVKGMLQHSRTGSHQKELTDINALCDEYLRLAYHGLRAKDKSFNAKFETDFDSSLEKIDVVPQDIGRVVLNLINNAFYAVNERNTLRHFDKLSAQGDSNYEPTVSVSTHHSLSSGEGRGEVIIKVKDNGNGITQKVLDKIFQPFFTTKPTGQGTGLGLSLSYDIVKAHGGELSVQTKENEGTLFIVHLPTK